MKLFSTTILCHSGGYRGVAMVSAETLSENGARAPILFTIIVGDKPLGVIHSVLYWDFSTG